MLFKHFSFLNKLIIFSLIGLITAFSISLINQKEMKEAKAYSTDSNYIIFTTEVDQDKTSNGVTFSLNGTNTDNEYANPDNLYINFDSTPIYDCFFAVPTTALGNYAYAFEAPSAYLNGTVSTLTFHVWQGKATTYNGLSACLCQNITVNLTSLGKVNCFKLNTKRKTCTATYVNEATLYDYFGSYFLSKCTCSGLGDSNDEAAVRSSWVILNGKGITGDIASKTPMIFNNYLANYHEVNSSKLSQALERYDYVVFYKYGLEDFLNRGSSSYHYYLKSTPSFYFNKKEEDMNLLIIIIASSILMISSLSLIVLIRSKKKNQ